MLISSDETYEGLITLLRVVWDSLLASVQIGSLRLTSGRVQCRQMYRSLSNDIGSSGIVDE